MLCSTCHAENPNTDRCCSTCGTAIRSNDEELGAQRLALGQRVASADKRKKSGVNWIVVAIFFGMGFFVCMRSGFSSRLFAFFDLLFLAGVVWSIVQHTQQENDDRIEAQLDSQMLPLRVARLNENEFMFSDYCSLPSTGVDRIHRYFYIPNGKYLHLSLTGRYWGWRQTPEGNRLVEIEKAQALAYLQE
jgi:hypothetical protein